MISPLQDPIAKSLLNVLKKEGKEDLNLRFSLIHSNSGYTATLALQPNKASLFADVFSFVLCPFPTCCAIHQLHSFYVSQINQKRFSEEEFHLCMDVILSRLTPHLSGWSSRRLLVAMVERDRRTFDGETPDPRLIDIKESDDIAMEYQWLYNYLKKQQKCRTTLMYNNNTENVIHLMEVLFDKTKFSMYPS